MSRGTKITILVVAGIIVIGLIAFFIILPVLRTAVPPAKTNANANVVAGTLVNRNVPRQTNAPSANVPPPTEAPDATKAAAAARTIATAFAERLGTYDNQHDLKNIDDLRTISTAAVWKYLDGEYRKSVEKTLPPAGEYFAVTSTAIRTDLVTADDANVNAVVQMQRAESGSSSNVSFASLNMTLKKVDGNWLVARLEWEK